MVAPNLEDNIGDILRKAQRAQAITDLNLMERSGLSMHALLDTLDGASSEPDHIAPLAECLGLNIDAAIAIAEGQYLPRVSPVPGLLPLNQPANLYPGATVNLFLAWDEASRHAWLFDCGEDPLIALESIRRHDLKLQAIFLTHGHPDHQLALEGIRAELGAIPAFAHPSEHIPGTEVILPGAQQSMGNLRVEARLTPGHSPGGLTYVLEGLERPVAIVGDALFAGSMGGLSAGEYEAARQAIREQILSLPGKALLCPGHGPITTVDHERTGNPFFA